MAGLLGSSTDLTLALQNRIPVPDIANTTHHDLKATPVTAGDTKTNDQFDDAKAREAANKFEALLIHNMLKSMRKTTMNEDKSNDRAIYDDMLDEKLADTMIKAGGLGISDQIVAQIRQQQGKKPGLSEQTSDAQRLNDLALEIRRSDFSSVEATTNIAISSNENSTTDIGHLQLATSLWSNGRKSTLSQQQQNFVQPLLAHARRNAQKLGTSADAILAVAALETGWGQSTIKDKQGNNSHNLFGIKATGSDNRYAKTLTTEYIEGKSQKLQAKFKTYDSPADAVDGFADFILSNPRYSNALEHAADPERFLQELQNAGYATDPRYADKAISIMRQIARNSTPL